MSVSSPHYLLFSEARHATRQDNAWRFVLESVNSQQRLAATGMEPRAGGERLELLAVVRGLEAIDCPARVTLVTKSRYVSRGLKYGMNEWRANSWQWERFGKLVPVRDHDLWRRVDRALLFHQVQCRAWQFASESQQDVASSAEHETALPGHRLKSTTDPGQRSPASVRCPKPTDGPCAESPTKTGRRKSFPQPARRRTDPSHRACPNRRRSVDSRSPPNRTILLTRKAPSKNTLNRKQNFSQRAHGILTRLKWSLSTWLSEHRLQPLA